MIASVRHIPSPFDIPYPTIVAGMKLERRARSRADKLLVVNLPPKTMRGVVSEGMLFDIGYAGGITPALSVPELPVADGARAG